MHAKPHRLGGCKPVCFTSSYVHRGFTIPNHLCPSTLNTYHMPDCRTAARSDTVPFSVMYKTDFHMMSFGTHSSPSITSHVLTNELDLQP